MRDDKNKTWINVIPLDTWTSIYNKDNEEVISFRLATYIIDNGKFSSRFDVVIGGGKMESIYMTGGKVQLNDEISVKVHTPIELHKVPDIGFSPKLVFSMPREFFVQEHRKVASKIKVKKKFNMQDAARHHTLRQIGEK